MSLFKLTKQLEIDQLTDIAKILNLPIATNRVGKEKIQKEIQSSLISYTSSQLKEKAYMSQYVESCKTLKLWKECVQEIIENRPVKKENEDLKKSVINQLINLDSPTKLSCSDSMESLVRDILLLLWEESSKKEKQKFRDIVRKEMKGHSAKFTDKEFDRTIKELLLGRVGGALALAFPAVAGLMLQKLTQGFMAWIAINILGQKALQVTFFGFLSGPLSWGITAGTVGITTILSVLKFKRQRGKFRFIQAILSIYAYGYQNRFNRRRGEVTA